MKQQIAIIGSGVTAKTIRELAHDAVILTQQEARGLSFPKSEPLVIINYAAEPLTIPEDKFICKGKHQYREVKTTENNVTTVEWICQCGRKL